MTPSKLSSCVIGIDVGGTNTDAVILQDDNVLAWHKTPTTSDIQAGVEQAIYEVMKKADISSGQVESVKIGTTQFVNAVLEQDSIDFPPALKNLMEGHFGYVDGGLQVDGTPILELNIEQLKNQAAIIKSKSITTIVIIGVYSPSNPAQEEAAQSILATELGSDFDISCSYTIGRLGFLERENASILNASLRRFARHVIAGFAFAIQKLGRSKLYITLNDGTLSKATTAADHPVKCFSSGPTNSARGAALLAKAANADFGDEREVLVVDVGGTTTDICALLKTGYPRQSAAYVKIAGVRTNFTIPDVHSVALGGGSIVRTSDSGRTSVGPDSVGSKLELESIAFGGNTLTTTDLALSNDATAKMVSNESRYNGLGEVRRIVEEAVDLVKTKQGDARVILVGGGSIIVGEHIIGVGEIIRPKYLEVANAVGAAIAKVSGAVDTAVVPGAKTMSQHIEDAKSLAIERCVIAGGDKNTIEVVEIDAVPISYTTDGATRLVVRVVGDLVEGHDEISDFAELSPILQSPEMHRGSEFTDRSSEYLATDTKGSSYEIIEQIDIKSYKPRLEGDLWYVSEMDLRFLEDGAGVLAVGSSGESYPSYLACLMALRSGEDLIIRRQDTVPDDASFLVAGFMGSPSVYEERIPGLTEITDAIKGVMSLTGMTDFDALIPHEIGGLNAFEGLLAAHRFKKPALDTDCVARAFPMLWQTVRCLEDIPITPSSIADGGGRVEVFASTKDNLEAEDLMRTACTKLGNLAGMCVNPILGPEAKTLPRNSMSHGRSIHLSRSLKQDIISSLLASENGSLLFTGKIISVTRTVAQGFTRGSVLLEQLPSTSLPSDLEANSELEREKPELLVAFENENLSAIEKVTGRKDEVLAVCPDLITFLDMANGAPVGIADYKYGLRVNVIALRAPPMWTTERGLEMGGPKAFGLDIEYKPITTGAYEPPKSVWEMFGNSQEDRM
ncbi:hypothetical protein B7494_g8138 [Chlorociboria aeruginascens]|nr:hypothetical protein B7494_g8138 [Chlorociboria aeruginascens]